MLKKFLIYLTPFRYYPFMRKTAEQLQNIKSLVDRATLGPEHPAYKPLLEIRDQIARTKSLSFEEEKNLAPILDSVLKASQGPSPSPKNRAKLLAHLTKLEKPVFDRNVRLGSVFLPVLLLALKAHYNKITQISYDESKDPYAAFGLLFLMFAVQIALQIEFNFHDNKPRIDLTPGLRQLYKALEQPPTTKNEPENKISFQPK